MLSSPYMFFTSAKTRSHEAEVGESAKATRAERPGREVLAIDAPPLEKLLGVIFNARLVQDWCMLDCCLILGQLTLHCTEHSKTSKRLDHVH